MDSRIPSISLRLLSVLALLSAVGPISIDTYLPAFVQIADQLSTTPAMVQLTLTAFMVGMGVGQVIVGPLSDGFGRRGFLIGGQAFAVLATLGCVFAPNIGTLIALRFIMGLAGGTGVVLARAIVVDLVASRAAAKAMSLMMLINGLAPILAPLGGAAMVGSIGWRGIFAVITGINVFALLCAIFLVRETLPVERRTERPLATLLPGVKKLLSKKAFVGYTLVTSFSFGVFFTYISGSPFVLQGHYGLKPGAYSFVFACCSGMLVLSSGINARLLNNFSPERLLLCGMLGFSVGTLMVLFTAITDAPLPIMVLSLLILTSSMGFVMGNGSALGSLMGRERAGAASAIMGAAQFAVAGVVSPMTGLGSNPVLALGLSQLACMIVAWLGWLLTRGSSSTAIVTTDPPVEGASKPDVTLRDSTPGTSSKPS